MQEWSQSVLAQNEKSALGFYLESHPLTEYRETLSRYATVELGDLSGISDGQEVIAGGAILSVRTTTIKNGRNKGEAMAAFVIEDLTGQADAVVFPDEYRAYREYVVNDRMVMVKGRADLRREAPQIKVSEVIPIERADEKLAGRVVVRLTAAGADPETLDKMAAIFKKHPGRLPVYLEIETPKAKVLVATGGDYRVDASKDLVRECSQLLGEGRVAFVGSNGGSRR